VHTGAVWENRNRGLGGRRDRCGRASNRGPSSKHRFYRVPRCWGSMAERHRSLLTRWEISLQPAGSGILRAVCLDARVHRSGRLAPNDHRRLPFEFHSLAAPFRQGFDLFGVFSVIPAATIVAREPEQWPGKSARNWTPPGRLRRHQSAKMDSRCLPHRRGNIFQNLPPGYRIVARRDLPVAFGASAALVALRPVVSITRVAKAAICPPPIS
jgi:hypothetical protein